MKDFLAALLPIGCIPWILKHHPWFLLRVNNLITQAFSANYYHLGYQTVFGTYYHGVQIVKCPLDLWTYQDIFYEVRPDLVIETGTHQGGSAYWMARQFDLLQHGRIVTIDIGKPEKPPQHPRITYINASSSDPATLAQVEAMIKPGERVMVILDSCHTKDHVLAEMRLFHKLVTPGSYMIVEDTNVNGHPASPSHGPGPMEAVWAFLAENRDFEQDKKRERLLLTFNPGGYLRKLA